MASNEQTIHVAEVADVSEIDQIDPNRALGVIKDPHALSKSSQPNPSKYWCFTLNNYKIDQIVQLEHIFRNECDWYVFQEETGETTGTPHLQGTICLKQRQRWPALHKWDTSIYFKETLSVSASVAYCTKVATRTGKIYAYGIGIPEETVVEEPYGWQLKVQKIIDGPPDKRTIHWVYDPIGNMGKTTYCKYLVVKQDALIC